MDRSQAGWEHPSHAGDSSGFLKVAQQIPFQVAEPFSRGRDQLHRRPRALLDDSILCECTRKVIYAINC